MKTISKLQYITTSATLAEQACKGGVDWIQLRLKNISYDDYRATALEVQAICKKYNATFIINDNVKLALDLNADGVHVGKEDPLLPDDVEEMLKRNYIIGCTANSIEDFIHLSGKPVDYIGLGPFRFTNTKQNLSPVLGIEGYQRIFSEIKERAMKVPPVIGIGGITEKDVTALLATGLHGIAVSGSITHAVNVTETAKEFNELVNKKN